MVRNPAIKADLNLDLIKRLRLDPKVVKKDAKGKFVFEPNPEGKPYIIWDSSQSSPPGFGVRVAAKKTYIIRRKVDGKSIMPTVGNFADFPDIATARAKAAELALKIKDTKENPNAAARRVTASEITLERAFSNYRQHLTTRANPAAANTLRVFDRAVKRFEVAGWSGRRIREITPDEILAIFIEGKDKPTANEQHFRWASVSVRHIIDIESLAAAAANRTATLTANPFIILHIKGMFRGRAQLELEREETMKRNPLGPTTTLGPFVEAAWSKKNSNDNETGVHYLILMLLWGCRTSEHAACQWGELLSESERKAISHVWLREDGDYGSYVFFHDTKNGRNHRLPLGTMAKVLLERRQESSAREAASRGFSRNARKWVFPAKSSFSVSGHYTSAHDLLGRLREEIGVSRLNRHDLRRSFGSVMLSLDVPEGIKKRFFNHGNASVTDLYTKAEWNLLREWINKIEQAIISTAPNVYNSLKPAIWPPLPAPDPHVCRPPKPRTGRPRKAID
jgi:integrase